MGWGLEEVVETGTRKKRKEKEGGKKEKISTVCERRVPIT